MRILIIDSYYGDFLDDFYHKNPELKNASYEKQKERLMAEQFGTADFYSKHFQKLGHEAEDFIINNEILQKQWAKENGITYRESHFQNIPRIRKYFKTNWETKILEAQIMRFKPDILFSHDLSLKPVFLRKIKKYAKLLVGQVASKLPPRECLECFDLIVSSLPHYVKTFRSWGIKSEYQPLAFESTILEKLTKTEKQYDVVHIGGYGSIHDERNKILEEAAKKVNMDFWGYGTERLDASSPILQSYHGQIWGLDMYNILYNSKITTTKHITSVAAEYANNMTLFEATGSGCMLITDLKDNLHELFEIGKEVETYSSAAELVEKIKYYLAHEEERKKIAQAGQSRTLKDHTFEKRMKELINIFQKYLTEPTKGYTILKNPNLVQLKSKYGEAWKDTSIPRKQLELTKRELPDFMNIPTMKSLVDLMGMIESDGQSVLEIGCSTGYYSEVLKKSGFSVEYEGCDYSPAFIKLARERYPEIKFNVSDATKLDYGTAQFDIVISGSCISHIVDYEKAISEAARVAKKYVVFHRTPTIQTHETMFTERTAYGVAMLGILFNEEELINLFKRYGLLAKTTSVLTSFYIEDLHEPISIKSYLCEKIS